MSGGVVVTAQFGDQQLAPGVLTMAVDYASLKQRMADLQMFVKDYLVEGEDYGLIPGSKQKTLYKSGADKLCDCYALAPGAPIIEFTRDDSKVPTYISYRITLPIISRADGRVISHGVGSCNSYEKKYKWRSVFENEVPSGVDKSTLKRVEKTGKKGGKYFVYLMPNEEVDDLDNTILKMAKKRALVDGVLNATRSSALFTQDMEDVAGNGQDGKQNQGGGNQRDQQRNRDQGNNRNNDRKVNQNDQPIQQFQIDQITKLAKDKGLTDTQLRHLVAGHGEGKELGDLTRGEAIRVLQNLQSFEAKAASTPPSAPETPSKESQRRDTQPQYTPSEKGRWITGSLVDEVVWGQMYEQAVIFVSLVNGPKIAVPADHPQQHLVDELIKTRGLARFYTKTVDNIELLIRRTGAEIEVLNPARQ